MSWRPPAGQTATPTTSDVSQQKSNRSLATVQVGRKYRRSVHLQRPHLPAQRAHGLSRRGRLVPRPRLGVVTSHVCAARPKGEGLAVAAQDLHD